MREYSVEIEGQTPLLMHWDNIEWADSMGEWKDDSANREKSKAGDDRTPAFRWIGSTYHDGQHVTIPSDNIMRCMMQGGAMVLVPGGGGKKTFKAQSQSGMMVRGDCPVMVGGNPIKIGPIFALMQEESFKAHRDAVAAMGFSLFVKRAKIGTGKHIRVRPRFDDWRITANIAVSDPQITQDVLLEILTYAGQYKGIGDWRPGGKTPGVFGMFTAKIKPTKK